MGWCPKRVSRHEFKVWTHLYKPPNSLASVTVLRYIRCVSFRNLSTSALCLEWRETGGREREGQRQEEGGREGGRVGGREGGGEGGRGGGREGEREGGDGKGEERGKSPLIKPCCTCACTKQGKVLSVSLLVCQSKRIASGMLAEVFTRTPYSLHSFTVTFSFFLLLAPFSLAHDLSYGTRL